MIIRLMETDLVLYQIKCINHPEYTKIFESKDPTTYFNEFKQANKGCYFSFNPTTKIPMSKKVVLFKKKYDTMLCKEDQDRLRNGLYVANNYFTQEELRRISKGHLDYNVGDCEYQLTEFRTIADPVLHRTERILISSELEDNFEMLSIDQEFN